MTDQIKITKEEKESKFIDIIVTIILTILSGYLIAAPIIMALLPQEGTYSALTNILMKIWMIIAGICLVLLCLAEASES